MAQVNGEISPSSATLSHIANYPFINDGIEYFKKNPFGQKSLELGDSAYQTFAKPFLPYLNRPFQYVSPYIKKADAVGDGALSQIDQRIPALKKPTDELVSEGKAIVFFPVRKGLETKSHVFDVYNSEYKKVGGDGLVTSGKAWISTGLVVTSETLSWVGDYLRAAKTEAKETGQNAARKIKE
ncbi:hypothetical protein GGR50DRAFT_216703 [Xylaria sp. CBS 124048]|nr:hypothetical protein GGR50DRAFT_216703 [Xylaria sp. CBS 124048]